MELLFYCLYPFILLFVLLEWIYEKIKSLFSAEQETQGQQEISFPADRQLTESQGDKLKSPDRNPATDDGMTPQERTLPYIQQKPKRETLPEFVFKAPPKKRVIKRKAQDKEQDKEAERDSR